MINSCRWSDQRQWNVSEYMKLQALKGELIGKEHQNTITSKRTMDGNKEERLNNRKSFKKLS